MSAAEPADTLLAARCSLRSCSWPSPAGVVLGLDPVRYQDGERQPDDLATEVGQHRSVLGHRGHPPRLVAAAVCTTLPGTGRCPSTPRVATTSSAMLAAASAASAAASSASASDRRTA